MLWGLLFVLSFLIMLIFALMPPGNSVCSTAGFLGCLLSLIGSCLDSILKELKTIDLRLTTIAKEQKEAGYKSLPPSPPPVKNRP